MAQSISRVMNVAFYSKKKKIEGGLLEKFKKGNNEVKNMSKDPGNRMVILRWWISRL